LVAVKHLVEDEEFFLANYSDGLTDAPLPEMIERFKTSGKIGCFVAVRPPFNFHLTEFNGADTVKRFRTSQQFDIWINGGYFIFRREIFQCIHDGEELVIEQVNRQSETGPLLGYRQY